MTDRCETCGWWARYQAGRKIGRCERSPPKDGEWLCTEGDEGCGEHTAVQRRRDRLMLAGQAIPGLVQAEVASTGGADFDYTAHEAIRLADIILEHADAMLTKAEEGS